MLLSLFFLLHFPSFTSRLGRWQWGRKEGLTWGCGGRCSGYLPSRSRLRWVSSSSELWWAVAVGRHLRFETLLDREDCRFTPQGDSRARVWRTCSSLVGWRACGPLLGSREEGSSWFSPRWSPYLWMYSPCLSTGGTFRSIAAASLSCSLHGIIVHRKISQTTAIAQGQRIVLASARLERGGGEEGRERRRREVKEWELSNYLTASLDEWLAQRGEDWGDVRIDVNMSDLLFRRWSQSTLRHFNDLCLHHELHPVRDIQHRLIIKILRKHIRADNPFHVNLQLRHKTILFVVDN